VEKAVSQQDYSIALPALVDKTYSKEACATKGDNLQYFAFVGFKMVNEILTLVQACQAHKALHQMLHL
jgi:hypothetical protein